MKKIRAVWVAVCLALIDGLAYAQADAVQTQAKDQFNNMAQFFIDVLSGPLSKIFALIFLIVAIWNVVKKEYGAALGCVLALLALIFLPQLLSMFNR